MSTPLMPDPAQVAPFEQGAALPKAVPAEGQPPGSGRLVVPHFATFQSLVNFASRVYAQKFDEAIRHNRQNAAAIRRDPVIFDAVRARQIPTAQLSWHLESDNEKDQVQEAGIENITNIITRIPRFQQLLMHLLEALWYGRYGVQMLYQWDFSTKKKRLIVRDFKPIEGDKIVFRWSGEAAILVHSTMLSNNLSMPHDPNIILTDRGHAHLLTPQDREQTIIHEHEPEDAAFDDPDGAGRLHGVGLRDRLYWIWWMRTQITAWLMDYLERVGAGGFTIYYYEAGSQNSLTEVKKAAEEQFRNNSVLFPRYKDKNSVNAGPGIQRVEASNGGAQLLDHLITDYFDGIIRRLVLGQTLSSETSPTGMGSEVADFHAETLSRIIKYDAVNLQETITRDLVSVLQRYNCPNCTGQIRFVFDVDKPNVKDTLEAAQAFFEMGGQIDEDELRSILGLAKPQPGHSILAKVPPMQPTAMGTPTGVPQLGQPGPDPSGQGPAPAPPEQQAPTVIGQ